VLSSLEMVSHHFSFCLHNLFESIVYFSKSLLESINNTFNFSGIIFM
jgi:hypothetical protein